MAFEDKTINCLGCGQNFTHTAADQAKYADRGLTNEPKRCRDCRAKRKEAGSSRGGGSAPRRGAAGGDRRSGGAGGSASRPRGGGNRLSFAATCDGCGVRTTVPFRPVEGRTVYCKDCFKGRRD